MRYSRTKARLSEAAVNTLLLLWTAIILVGTVLAMQ
jgi:hypothetical protein